MKKIIYSLLYLAILFFVSRFIFDQSNLYYEIWWLDIPMHILGGLGVAALAVSILNYKNFEITFGRIVIAFFLVAIVWEIYEYICSSGGDYIWGGWFDTIKDMINGFLGASIVYLIYKKQK